MVFVIGNVLSAAGLEEAKVELGVADEAVNVGGSVKGEDCFGGRSGKWWLLLEVGGVAIVKVSSPSVSAFTGKLSLGGVSWEAHRTLENI